MICTPECTPQWCKQAGNYENEKKDIKRGIQKCLALECTNVENQRVLKIRGKYTKNNNKYMDHARWRSLVILMLLRSERTLQYTERKRDDTCMQRKTFIVRY